MVLGTERLVDGALRVSALVIDEEGTRVGFQDKVQLDPSEDGIYAAGSGRRMFPVGGLRFGVAICHEGWRYPETVRWGARRRGPAPADGGGASVRGSLIASRKPRIACAVSEPSADGRSLRG